MEKQINKIDEKKEDKKKKIYIDDFILIICVYIFLWCILILLIIWMFKWIFPPTVEDYRLINIEKWNHNLEIYKKRLEEMKNEATEIREKIALAQRCLDLNKIPWLAFDCEFQPNEK